MTKQLPENPSYLALIKAVKAALTSGLIHTQRIIEYQRVKTYWTIGHEICRAVEARGSNLTLNNELYQRISDNVERTLKLDLSTDMVRRSIQFAKAYPVFPADTSLTFTHYLALMRVTDEKKRRQLEKKAVEKAMSSPQLKQAVLALNVKTITLLSPSLRKLPVERGEPYIYHLRPYDDLAGERIASIDCGFKVHIPLNGAIGIRAPKIASGKMRYVRSVKKDGAYQARLAVRKRASVYTYPARIIKVVDGDTLDALIDLGFGIRVRERFRLKAIDAPEIKARSGQDARAFLADYLAQCPIIIVRTVKAEMYGRWLGDIFALEGSDDPYAIAARGVYVNQLMLDKGFATLYK